MRAAIHPAGIPVMSLVILLLSQCVNQMFAQRFSHTAALPRQQFGVSSSDSRQQPSLTHPKRVWRRSCRSFFSDWGGPESASAVVYHWGISFFFFFTGLLERALVPQECNDVSEFSPQRRVTGFCFLSPALMISDCRFQESEMVRETSQWEREEMEKVVSEATRSSCGWGGGRAKSLCKL